ncbi:MAG: hypothetical protein IPM29_19225 [Planctomycetes bacterium]|nr:hypothetical protein [Planctomycetota bacterium]
MNRSTLVTTLVTNLALVAAATAQGVPLVIKPADGTVRYTVDTRDHTVAETSITVDGQPFEGRGGRMAGPRETDASSHVVFDEQAADGVVQRTYVEGRASMTMPGRDGEPMEQEVESGLVGTPLFIVEDDRGVVVLQGSADGEELPRFAAMGMPPRVSFAGITPDKSIDVGGQFELPAAFLQSFAMINHPVRPAMEPGARGPGGRQPPGEGQPPERGQGAPQRGQFGGRVGGGMGRMGGGADFAMLAAPGLSGAITGELYANEGGIAKIRIKGVRQGEGDFAELGLTPQPRRPAGGEDPSAGGDNPRGPGRGGFGGMAPQTGKVAVELAGELWIDTRTHQLVKLVVEGNATMASSRSMDRGGQQMDMATETHRTFRVAVEAGPAPAPKGDGGN